MEKTYFILITSIEEHKDKLDNILNKLTDQINNYMINGDKIIKMLEDLKELREVNKHLHYLMVTGEKRGVAKATEELSKELEKLRKDAARYRYVRTISGYKFQNLLSENINTGVHFDVLVDQAKEGK